MLRNYLLLIRLPNTFTVPPDILVGYFVVGHQDSADALSLPLLIVSSVLLYISGIVFNDLFDLEEDKIDSPNRPLPSNKISVKSASLLAVSTMSSANIIAYHVSQQSLLVSFVISCTIIAYDYKLKKTKVGFIIMGLARGLNILLGASTAFFVIPDDPQALFYTIFITSLMVIYVSSITLLSKGEITGIANMRKIVAAYGSVFLIIVLLAIALFSGIFSFYASIFLIIFSIGIGINFKKIVTGNYTSLIIQKAVKNMIFSIIILDAFFITGNLGIYYGALTALFVIPSMILARNLYVT
ncbi:MAG TPA: UbiA family prenyltransferase [Nitrososphaeraceae archaeon]|jgi:4-hydroxybenzoate polyprenyltransferase|nr:UbiA family prenyltransferase [Nitrososphaeraceae archaeon]